MARRTPRYCEQDERLYARWQALEEHGIDPHAASRAAVRVERERRARQGELFRAKQERR